METHKLCLQSDLQPDDYLAFGLAKCYRMEEGVVSDVWIIEPLTGATLECINKGLPTSYRRTIALRADQALTGSLSQPTGIDLNALEPLLSEGEQVCLLSG